MAYKTYRTKLIGINAYLQHNPQLADPLAPGTKKVKAITSKKKKTEADYIELGRIQFLYSLYMGTDGPIMPAHQIHGLLIEAAKKLRLGKDAQAGIIVDKNARLEYEGPRTPDELWADTRFVSVMMKKQNKVLIRRVRPKFENWSAELTFDYDDEILQESQIDQILQMSLRCGVGDDRPFMGKFKVEKQF